MEKEKTDSQIMKERAKTYGPVQQQMEVIGKIQFELFQYCMDRNGGDPSRKALAHLAAGSFIPILPR